MTEHGYLAYTYGCRCRVCKDAKAAYMRRRRAAGRAAARQARGRHVADGITHGTRSGYEEHGCRCLPCTDARLAADQRYRNRTQETA